MLKSTESPSIPLILGILADVLLVAGVLFLGWSPIRPVCFYFLELISIIMAFMVFNAFREGFAFLPINIIGAAFIVLLFGAMLNAIVKLSGLMPDESASIADFYAPYYDVSVYVVMLVVARIADIRYYKGLPGEGGTVAFRFTLATELMLIPLLLFGVSIIYWWLGNGALGLIVPLVILRTFMIWKRRRDIRK